MTVFRYRAVNTAGDVVEGEHEAENQDALVRWLHADGHVLLYTEQVVESAGNTFSRHWRSRQRITQADVTNITITLSTLLKGGLSLDSALQAMAELADRPAIAELVVELASQIRAGATFAAALESHPNLFSRFYINMVRVGETTGTLDESLVRLSEFMNHSRDLRQSVQSALMYPMVLVVVAFLSLLLVLGYVIPRFSRLFEDAGQTLPALTAFVVSTGELVSGYWWVLAAMLVGVYVCVRWARGQYEIRYRFDATLLSLPLIGSLLARIETARFSRTMATLVGGGVALHESLVIAGATIENLAVGAALKQAVERVRAGGRLTDALRESGRFPGLALQLIDAGEKGGELESVFQRLGDIYADEVQRSLKRLLTLLEPCLIVGIGVVVAVIILSIVSALFAVYDIGL